MERKIKIQKLISHRKGAKDAKEDREQGTGNQRQSSLATKSTKEDSHHKGTKSRRKVREKHQSHRLIFATEGTEFSEGKIEEKPEAVILATKLHESFDRAQNKWHEKTFSPQRRRGRKGRPETESQ